MKFMMITAQPEIARYVTQHGVNRIFVDLERIGKQERQKNRDTWISPHTFEDIAAVRSSIGASELLARLNPWHPDSSAEIDEAIRQGADLLMLPMFRIHAELNDFCRAVDGRVPVVPLVETVEAFSILDQVARTNGVSEVFIGLNDLHIAMGMNFMFEPLAKGHIDQAAAICRAVRMPFGFGGIARVGEGLLPAEKILAEHVRLGSHSVILSRTFHRGSQTLTALHSEMDFALEFDRLRAVERDLKMTSKDDLERNRIELIQLVDKISAAIKQQSALSLENSEAPKKREAK